MRPQRPHPVTELAAKFLTKLAMSNDMTEQLDLELNGPVCGLYGERINRCHYSSGL